MLDLFKLILNVIPTNLSNASSNIKWIYSTVCQNMLPIKEVSIVFRKHNVIYHCSKRTEANLSRNSMMPKAMN